MAPRKILILTASQEDQTRINDDPEIQAIKKQLKLSENQNKFEIIVKLAVEADELIPYLLEEKPEIVHFYGHEKKTGISVEDVKALEKLFENKVECVLFNACYYTDIQAKAIKEHIQNVISMSDKIEDNAAIRFAAHFYAALINGRSYRDAYEIGIIDLKLLGIQGNLLPVFGEKIPTISLNPPTFTHYNHVINAFKSGQVVPFLGPGINLYDGQQSNQRISDIQIAKYLAGEFGMTNFFKDFQEYLGVPCSVCLVSAEDLPVDCPIKKALLEGKETTASCPLANEQALAVAKVTLQCLAQYIKFTNDLEQVYDKLENLFKEVKTPNKLHDFFANLPKQMNDKGYHLPYQLLVTTNYDDMLEQAFKLAKQEFDLVYYVAEGEEDRGRFLYKPYEETAKLIEKTEKQELNKDRPVIIKLYGAFKNFVITEEHYINYLVHRDIDQLLTKKLLEILKKSHKIFMGYSPNDRNLRVIVNRLWGGDVMERKSWMIHQSKLGAVNKEFWTQRNVELLDSDLVEYVDKLSDILDKRISEPSPYDNWRS